METIFDALSTRAGSKMDESISKLRGFLNLDETGNQHPVEAERLMSAFSSAGMLKIPMIKGAFNNVSKAYAQILSDGEKKYTGDDAKIRLCSAIIAVGGYDVFDKAMGDAMFSSESASIADIMAMNDRKFGQLIFGYLSDNYPEFSGVMEYVKMFTGKSFN